MPGQHVLPSTRMDVQEIPRRAVFFFTKCAAWINRQHVVHMGWPAMLVTWDGIWLPQQWYKPKNILWRVDQSNHLEQWEQADKKARANWSKGADSPFQ
jgi:hypothetical protein